MQSASLAGENFFREVELKVWNSVITMIQPQRTCFAMPQAALKGF